MWSIARFLRRDSSFRPIVNSSESLVDMKIIQFVTILANYQRNRLEEIWPAFLRKRLIARQKESLGETGFDNSARQLAPHADAREAKLALGTLRSHGLPPPKTDLKGLLFKENVHGSGF